MDLIHKAKIREGLPVGCRVWNCTACSGALFSYMCDIEGHLTNRPLYSDNGRLDSSHRGRYVGGRKLSTPDT